MKPFEGRFDFLYYWCWARRWELALLRRWRAMLMSQIRALPLAS